MRGRIRKGQPLSGLRCQVGEVMKRAGKSARRANPMMAGRKARSDWSGGQEKPLSDENSVPVPQTDTGGGVENTKATGKPSLRN